ncbi:MAG: gph [Sphingobacteriales bacterium]|nr:gph [Sphingobacteriales bacterium]
MDTSLKNKFDSIIFDLDGTLWDSTHSVAEAWTAGRNQVDYVAETVNAEQVAGIAGMAYDAIYEVLFPSLSPELRKDFMAICAKSELEVLADKGGILYPNLVETLEYLKQNYRLFIVSNCQCGYIEVFLEKYNLEHYFEGHQCFGTKDRPKAENIKDIVNDFELKSPVYVGDTLGDYQSSMKANVPFIFCAFGFGKVDEGQIASIENLSDLKELL